MKRCSVRPYEGDENYIFISYCHKDKAKVFPIIEQLAKDGFRVWYDEGIAPGEDWPEVIAAHLNACSSCIAFISNNSISSHNCKKEINYAVFLNKFFISVFLEPVAMTLGMQMQLSTNQSILKYTIDSEYEFFTKLYDAKELSGCIGASNPNIVVSKPSEYSEEDIDIGKTRDPFSNSWFMKKTETKRIENETETSEATEIKEEIAQLLKLVKENEETILQLSKKSESLIADIKNNKKCDEEARITAEHKLKEAENEVESLSERLLIQKDVVVQIKSSEEERLKSVREREITEKAEQDSLSEKLESEKKEQQELVKRLKDAESKLAAIQKQQNEQKAESQSEEILKNTEESNLAVGTREQNSMESTDFVLKRERTGQVINILIGSHIIGRSIAQAKYCIEDNKKIGRTHATIIATKNKVIIVDNNSLNKTCINGSVLEPNVKYLLKDGDMVKIANELFYFSKSM